MHNPTLPVLCIWLFDIHLIMHSIEVPGALYECNQNSDIRQHMVEELQSFAQKPYNTAQTQDMCLKSGLALTSK